jgi:hypothetical protein
MKSNIVRKVASKLGYDQNVMFEHDASRPVGYGVGRNADILKQLTAKNILKNNSNNPFCYELKKYPNRYSALFYFPFQHIHKKQLSTAVT